MNETNQGLERTGRFCGGLIDDIKRRAPYYGSDFYQGFHLKVLGSSLFMFFACLANAIAFGLLTSVATNGEIGTSEMLIVTAIGGVCFALFSGQPLTILGGTGPIVIFTGLLYATCESVGIDFLPTYAWVGVWSGILLIICAVTDLSYLMKYFTRFTDEIFAALVALIFIVEAVKDMVFPFTHPPEGQDQISHDTAFLTLVLALGTFMIARNLKALRNSNYLSWTLREFLADFGPSIAIGIMSIVAVSFGALHANLSLGDSTIQIGTPDGVTLKVADVPETFVPPSMVDMFSIPTWVIFASIIPALMATILLYLDQNITTRLVNAPGNRLTKGAGFHLDLLVVGLITLIGSVFGLPWMVAATVHALNHVKSLATQETVNLGGEMRERIKESPGESHFPISCSPLDRLFITPATAHQLNSQCGTVRPVSLHGICHVGRQRLLRPHPIVDYRSGTLSKNPLHPNGPTQNNPRFYRVTTSGPHVTLDSQNREDTGVFPGDFLPPPDRTPGPFPYVNDPIF